MRDTSGQAREHSSEDKGGYILKMKEKVGRGEDHLLPHSWVDRCQGFISLVPPLTLYGLNGTVMVLFKSHVY